MVDNKTNPVVTDIAHLRSRAGARGRGDQGPGHPCRRDPGEPGCVSFRAYRDAADPDRFALHEDYTSERAFQEHRQSAHFARCFAGRIVPLLQERAWSRYAEIPPAGAARHERPR
jgi:hypothetical protein